MNQLQNLNSAIGASQPWWYVRTQLLVLLTALLLCAVGVWTAVPLLLRAW